MQQLYESSPHRFLASVIAVLAVVVVVSVGVETASAADTGTSANARLWGQAGIAPAIAFGPSSHDYGTIDSGATSSQTFVVRNDGFLPTWMLKVSLAGSSAFTKTADSCAGKFLWPWMPCSITVQYAPTSAGSTDNASLTVSGLKVSATATLTGKSTASSADISLSPFSGPNDNVRVINGGPSAATVTVILECSGSFGMGDDFPGEWDGAFGPPGDHWKTSKDPIPSGGSLTFSADCFVPGGYVEVYSSTQPDPDSTPNNAVTTEDDYLAIS